MRRSPLLPFLVALWLAVPIGAGTAEEPETGPTTEPCKGCQYEDLVLADVSCAPPHGGGPDGRVWVRLTWGKRQPPTPYDWQLARMSHDVDIFAWYTDPTYAFVYGEAGTYQASAETRLGGLTLLVTMPPQCDDAQEAQPTR